MNFGVSEERKQVTSTRALVDIMEAALAQHRLAVLLPLPSQRRLKLRRDKWSCTCPPLPRSHYLQSKLRLETSASAPAAPEPSFSALLPHGARNNEAISLPLDYYRCVLLLHGRCSGTDVIAMPL